MDPYPRIVYDDRFDRPWVIIYGEDFVFAQYRTRKAAELDIGRIWAMLESFGVLGQ